MPSKPIPENYRRIDSTEQTHALGQQSVREIDPAETLTVVIRVKEAAGQAGLDQIAAFARERGLVVIGKSATQYSVVIWGTAAQIGDFFAVQLQVYGSAAGMQRGWEGYLYLPAPLAENVAGILGIVEREIENLDRWLGGVWAPAPAGPDGQGKAPIKVFDLHVPKTGPQGPVTPGAYSLVQEFDVGWLSDPGYQRLLDNMQASPGAFKTVRVMKVFTSGGTPETGILGTAVAGTVWPAGSSSTAIDFTSTFAGLTELTSRGLIPFVVLSFFPDGIYNNTSYQTNPAFAGLGGSTGPSPNPSFPGTGILAADWTQILTNWQTLVQTFFDQLIMKFGATSRATSVDKWWFEVWNEPDNASMWAPYNATGDLTYYQQLYQATSKVVTTNNYKIRLGGPTVMGPNVVGSNTTIPGTDPTLMSTFIGFVKSNSLKCDFLSFHGKGSWSPCLNGAPLDGNGNPVANGAPSLQAAIDAADQTASFAKAAGLTPVVVVNDEADIRVNFAVPFRPRMTQQFPAWLTALMVAYDSLGAEPEYASNGITFMVGSDNAELQLVGWTQSVSDVRDAETHQEVVTPSNTPTFSAAAFGQQRSIMTAASTGGPSANSWVEGTCPIDLLKVPAYNFYELLRLLGDQHGTFLTGSSNYYPNSSDLFHMITGDSTQIASVFCVYPPKPPSGPAQALWTLNYAIVGIPWASFNWYQFQIDGTVSNSFNAANGPAQEPVASSCVVTPSPQSSLSLSGLPVTAIRKQQELQVKTNGVKNGTGGIFNVPNLTIPTYTTTVFWITENQPKAAPFAGPKWIGTPTVDTTPAGTNVVLRWQPETDSTFYSYQVARDGQDNIVSPGPLRAAMWIDTNVTGSHTYWVRSVSASDGKGGWSASVSA
jgi:hypothetical protein